MPPHRPFLCLVLLTAFGLQVTVSWAASAIVLTDVTDTCGIDFQHTDGSSGDYFIMETVSAGLALFDYDRDGLIDIYFLNGAPLSGDTQPPSPRNTLYRNQGHWRFVDVTEASGLGDTGFGLGVAVGDYDNDGDPDVYLNNSGPNALYQNNGDGTFRNVTQTAGVANGTHVGAGACFLDIEGDGDLDLYVSNYLEFAKDRHRPSLEGGHQTYMAPVHYTPVPDTLYRNNGNGTFADISQVSGIGAHAGWGMGIVCGDYDGDGDTDLFIGNDVAENFLFQNNGQGQFEEVGLFTGTAYTGGGTASASMGVDCGDYDNDGLLDFQVTSYQQELTTLYRNLGNDLFDDVTMQTGAATGTLPMVTWGTALVDLDNDTDRDLFIACGHLQDNIDKYDDVSTYRQRNILLANTGTGAFVDVSRESGTGMQVKLSSRGAGFDDLDNDGDLDAVILNSRCQATVVRNDAPGTNHWLQVKLQGTKTNRDGIGAQVTITAGDLQLMDEVHSGRGYQSHYGMRLHFGLGSHKAVDKITVGWIGGTTETFPGVAADQYIALKEGQGAVVQEKQ